MLFGRATKKPAGKTFLILDVENGSVGSALVRFAPGEKPALMGEKRAWLPVSNRVSGAELMRAVEAGAKEALQHAAHFAARLRGHESTAPLGTINRALIFLAPPWGKPDLAAGKPDFVEQVQESLHSLVRASFEVPSNFFTTAGAVAVGGRLIGHHDALMCVITGEVSELLLMQHGVVHAHASIPVGSHLVVRTLRSHAGLTEHESRSALRLPFANARLREPYTAAAEHYVEHFADAASDLFARTQPQQIVFVGSGGAGEWFAQAIVNSEAEKLSQLFPKGGSVRAMHAHHLTPHLSGHAPSPDLGLALDALFVTGL